MVSYGASFVASTIISIPFVNRHLNRKVACTIVCLIRDNLFKATYLVGALCGIGNCVFMFYAKSSSHNIDAYMYIIAIILGLAQAIALVTSLAITADLINMNTV